MPTINQEQLNSIAKGLRQKFPNVSSDVLKQSLQQKMTKEGYVLEQKQGFWGGLAKGLAQPFAQIGVAAYNVGKTSLDVAQRNYQQAAQDISASRTLPFMGRTQPVVTGKESGGVMAQKIAGAAADIAPWFTGVGEAETIAKAGYEGLGKGILKAGARAAKEAVVPSIYAGALTAGGEQIKKGADLQKTLILGGVGGVAGGVGGAALAGAGGAAIQAGRVLPKVLFKPAEYAATKVDASIEEGISKGIKPTVVGKPSLSKMKGFYEKAKQAVRTIAENRKALNLVDENGEAIARPRSAAQMAQAIDQTKKIIYQKYNALAKQAGEKGAAFDVTSIVDELAKVSQDLGRSPEIRMYAEKMFNEIAELQGQPPEIVERRIAEYNSTLNSFYANPDRVSKAKAQVDASVANLMREQLDSAIESAGGAGYQELKNQYGALKTIEKEVNKRALVNARKASKNVIDLTNIFTGGELVGGLVTGNVGAVTKGTFGAILKSIYKELNRPDRYIDQMFKDVFLSVPEKM